MAMSQHYWVLDRLCLFVWVCFCNMACCLTVDGNMAVLCLFLCHCLSLPPPFPLLLYLTLWSWQPSGVWGVWREDNYLPSFPSPSAKHWQSWSEMKAERLQPPTVSQQILLFICLCKCLCIQYVDSLVCVCLESVHRSLSDTFFWV